MCIQGDIYGTFDNNIYAGFILVAVPVMVVAVCALVVSVLVSVALSVRIHCLKNKGR